MNRVIQAVERIRIIPESRVDCSIQQGHEAVLEQFQLSFGEASEDDITNLRQALIELHTWVAPHRLPDDYVFFQEFYGGLTIRTSHYDFFIEGLGPMTDDWYGDVMGDDGIYENGLLLIGTLAFGNNPRQFNRFFLDVVGIIDQYCVIQTELQGPPHSELLQMLQSPLDHPTDWAKVAGSFTEWLELVAETQGSLGNVGMVH
jgi:hypothetical protein